MVKNKELNILFDKREKWDIEVANNCEYSVPQIELTIPVSLPNCSKIGGICRFSQCPKRKKK